MAEQICQLCGLDTGNLPFLLQDKDQVRVFCCEGCRGIYAMLNDLPDTPLTDSATPQN